MMKPSTIRFVNFKQLLEPRPRDAHKGLFGHVLVIGGDYGLAGAARLAGEAALRIGAGLVSIATRKENVAAIMSERPELMVYAINTAEDLTPLLNKATVLIVGPGLGQTHWSRSLFERLITATQLKVIDADALNLLALQPQKSAQWILTPHPGEAARLLQCNVGDIQNDRITSIKKLQQKYGGVVILKGAGSLVCNSHSLSICQAGNPGMASGGMGDLLSGIIGGLLAQHFTLPQAAELGVYLHATAGDMAAMQHGERGLLASDLLPYLQQLINPP